MIWKKLSRVPSIYRTAGAFGVAGRLVAVRPLSSLCYLAGTVVMKATTLRLGGLVEKLALQYEVTRAGPSDIADMVAAGSAEEQPFLRRSFPAYLERGAAGILIRRAGRVIAYNWVFRNRYELEVGSPERRIDLLLGPRQVFFGSGYVQPEHRLKGVFPLMLHASAAAFGPADAMWSSSHIWNDISLRSHQRLGFEKVLEIRCIDTLGRQRFLHNRGPGRRWQRIRGGAMALSERAPDRSTTTRAPSSPAPEMQ